MEPTTEDRGGRIAWRLFDIIFGVLMLLLTTAGGILVKDVRENAKENAALRIEVTKISEQLKGTMSNRFRDVDGARLESKLQSEIKDTWKEISAIKAEIASLPPQEWRDRIRALEEFRWSTNPPKS